MRLGRACLERSSGDPRAISAGRCGQRPARRWPGRSRRSIRGGRCSVAATATAWVQRSCVRRRSAATTAVCGPASRRPPARTGRPWRVWRRRADLVGEVAGQALVAGVDLGVHPRVAAQQGFDAFGAHGSSVVHAARTGRPCPEHPAVAVADHGRRTCTSVPSIRRVTPWAAASANTSAKVSSRMPGRSGTAKPAGRAGAGPRARPGSPWTGQPEHHRQHLVRELEAHTPPG